MDFLNSIAVGGFPNPSYKREFSLSLHLWLIEAHNQQTKTDLTHISILASEGEAT